MILTIPANDHGKMRVFVVAKPPPDGLVAKTPAGFAATFGAAGLNPDYVDVINLDDLGDMTLPDYITRGYEFSLDDVDLAALSSVTGLVVLVMSRAFSGVALTLTLAPGVTHVTTCGEAVKMSIPTKIETESSAGILSSAPAKAPKSDAAMSGRVAMIALLVMFALVGLMIWVAG